MRGGRSLLSFRLASLHMAEHNEKEEGVKEEEEGHGDMWVSGLVSCFGPGFPMWFDGFTELAAASAGAVD